MIKGLVCARDRLIPLFSFQFGVAVLPLSRPVLVVILTGGEGGRVTNRSLSH